MESIYIFVCFSFFGQPYCSITQMGTRFILFVCIFFFLHPPSGFPASSEALKKNSSETLPAASEAIPSLLEVLPAAYEALPTTFDALPAASEAPFVAIPPCLVLCPIRGLCPLLLN